MTLVQQTRPVLPLMVLIMKAYCYHGTCKEKWKEEKQAYHPSYDDVM
jgi:hypothetical protein